MSKDAWSSRVSHLDYYLLHNIAPVRYDLSSLSAHFQRRAALYRTLGIPPLAVRGANVLEVAAGTGQNSLYIASLLPERFTLVEPNPTGVAMIRDLYAGFEGSHTAPRLVESKLEDYAPAERFDLVLCENWLGAAPHERALLRKLASLVAPGGFLVLTCVSPAGILPNVIRRALSGRLVALERDFEERTRVLVEAFGPHLATIRGMTRSPLDWVHDNMMNPAYFDLCLTIPMVLADTGPSFQATGTSPCFRRDWRWFKALHGPDFEFNACLVREYERMLGGFIDYRAEDPEPSPVPGLEDAVLALMRAVRTSEATDAGAQARAGVTGCLSDVVERLARAFPEHADWAARAGGLLARDTVDAGEVAGLTGFPGWFGRETLYLALERVGDA